MFLIRADGNAAIGAGHLMRCLTIADRLRECGGGRDILFVCADGESAGLARSRGYEAFVLQGSPRELEGELSAWQRIPGIGKSKNSILVDSYFVTGHYLREIGKYGHVTLLDDAGEERYPVDRIINYNAFADRARYERLYRDLGTELILGSAYVPVRPQFREGRYVVREKAGNILITAGGGDVDNIAGKILERVRGKVGGMLNYHLVVGGFSPHLEEMRALERQCANVHIHHDVRDMAGLMGQCDLAVTAGGSTVYELAVMGVPFVCFSYAENQERIAEYLHKRGTAFWAGAYHWNPEAVLERITGWTMALMQDYGERKACYRRERELTDGLGAERLAGLLAGIP